MAGRRERAFGQQGLFEHPGLVFFVKNASLFVGDLFTPEPEEAASPAAEGPSGD